VLLERRRGVLRRIVAPEQVDEPVGGDDLAGVEQQDGEDAALLRAAERQAPLAVEDLERAEEPVVEAVAQSATVPAESLPACAVSALRKGRDGGFPGS
jgi:hypothetical protein